MYSFIPSWYSGKGNWVKDTKIWHMNGDLMEFDDTVNQVKIFQMAGEEVEILLLGCMPELRHFLHRERISGVPVWSAFDEIQDIRGNIPRQIFLKECSWPEDTEWFYTPFLMTGYRSGELYVKAEFAEDGWWCQATVYKDGQPSQTLHVDDRGFISYSEVYRNGRPAYRVFYNRRTEWQILENLETGKVSVNKTARSRFEKAAYDCLSEVVEEVLRRHFEGGGEEKLIVAMDAHHDELVRRTAGGRDMVYSVFTRRNGAAERELFAVPVNEGRLLVTDTQYLAEKIKGWFPDENLRVMDISPYDARLSFGKSTTIRALKVLLYADSLDNPELQSAVKGIFEYMKVNKDVELTIGISRHVKENIPESLFEELLRMIMKTYEVDYAINEPQKDIAENEVKIERNPRVFVRKCRTETELIELLSDHRIIVDISPQPDLYLQIAGISAGVPVVIRADSQYVRHRENGWTLSRNEMNVNEKGKDVVTENERIEDGISGSRDTSQEIVQALHYYLDGLANWNKSLIYSLNRITEYTNGNIVGRWKEAMSEEL